MTEKPKTQKSRWHKVLAKIRQKTEYSSQHTSKARLVGRTVHHIEPWSTFKISLLLTFSIWVIAMVAGAILWGIASALNLIQRIENFVTELLALETYNLPFVGTFFILALLGLAWVLITTAFMVLMCIIYNQLSGIFGGVRMLVLEEESLQMPTSHSDRLNESDIEEDTEREIGLNAPSSTD